MRCSCAVTTHTCSSLCCRGSRVTTSLRGRPRRPSSHSPWGPAPRPTLPRQRCARRRRTRTRRAAGRPGMAQPRALLRQVSADEGGAAPPRPRRSHLMREAIRGQQRSSAVTEVNMRRSHPAAPHGAAAPFRRARQRLARLRAPVPVPVESPRQERLLPAQPPHPSRRPSARPRPARRRYAPDAKSMPRRTSSRLADRPVRPRELRPTAGLASHRPLPWALPWAPVGPQRRGRRPMRRLARRRWWRRRAPTAACNRRSFPRRLPQKSRPPRQACNEARLAAQLRVWPPWLPRCSRLCRPRGRVTPMLRACCSAPHWAERQCRRPWRRP